MSRKDAAHSKTILHWASETGHKTAVKHGLDLRADIQAKDKYGETALHYAAENGHLDIVRTLVLAGSNLHALDDHLRTPLDCARGKGPGTGRRPHPLTIEYLTSH